MTWIRQHIALFLLAFVGVNGFAQETPDSLNVPFSAQINLIAKSYGDSIVLRWAPTTPGAWAYLNEVGYVIERTSFTGESDFDPSDYSKLNTEPIIPYTLEAWEPVVKSGPDQALSAIAAQALYGDSFGESGATLYEQADEFMNRYSFSILAADLSIATANALGLRFVDQDVLAETNYIYRVFGAQATADYQIDTAYYVLENLPYGPIPVPEIAEVYGSEYNVLLSWSKTIHEPIFSAYIIERSEDGNDFEPLTDVPFINPAADNLEDQPEHFQYSDSVPVNYKSYYYRIIGLTPFGEKSAPSEIKVGMGRDRTPPSPPSNVEANPLDSETVEITWDYTVQERDLDGFYIGRGDDLETNFTPLHEDKIPKDKRSFIDSSFNQLSGNYYVVAAVDTAGNGSISMVSYAMVIDSIPPDPPIELMGEIDSSGVVTLQWKLGEEVDLAGYMIYFSNSADHVFSTVNREPLADTIYQDTIQIKTLTKNVYYRLKAVDTRWNYSEYSEVLELKRPDLIPPTTPVFNHYKLTEEGIELKWIPSSSDDVVGYDLIISEGEEETRRIFFESGSEFRIYNYTDNNLQPGKKYIYTVTAVDESGLRSIPSHPVTITALGFKPKEAIDNLTLTEDNSGNSFTLVWGYPNEEVKRYVLYRASNGSAFATYKSIPSSENSYQDQTIRRGVAYEYTVKAVLNSGKQTPFSNIVSGKVD